MKETHLFLPVKILFESMGFEVEAEIEHIDIVAKKEVDRDGKVSISKAKKSRYDFYLKLMVFDETPVAEKKGTVRPNYYEIEPEPEPENNTTVETVETFDTTTDVPDSEED